VAYFLYNRLGKTNRLRRTEMIITADNLEFWAGDNVSKEQLFILLSEIINYDLKVEDFRQDIIDYFNSIDCTYELI
jgi:hypothetical protein